MRQVVCPVLDSDGSVRAGMVGPFAWVLARKKMCAYLKGVRTAEYDAPPTSTFTHAVPISESTVVVAASVDRSAKETNILLLSTKCSDRKGNIVVPFQVTSVHASPSSSVLLLGDATGAVHVYDALANGVINYKCATDRNAKQSSVSALDYCPESNTVFAALTNGVLLRFALKKGDGNAWRCAPSSGDVVGVHPHEQSVVGLRWCGANKRLWACTFSKETRTLDLSVVDPSVAKPKFQTVSASGDVFAKAPAQLVALRQLPDGGVLVASTNNMATRVVCVGSDGHPTKASTVSRLRGAACELSRRGSSERCSIIGCDEGSVVQVMAALTARSTSPQRVEQVRAAGESLLPQLRRAIEADIVSFTDTVCKAMPASLGTITVPDIDTALGQLSQLVCEAQGLVCKEEELGGVNPATSVGLRMRSELQTLHRQLVSMKLLVAADKAPLPLADLRRRKADQITQCCNNIAATGVVSNGFAPAINSLCVDTVLGIMGASPLQELTAEKALGFMLAVKPTDSVQVVTAVTIVVLYAAASAPDDARAWFLRELEMPPHLNNTAHMLHICDHQPERASAADAMALPQPVPHAVLPQVFSALFYAGNYEAAYSLLPAMEHSTTFTETLHLCASFLILNKVPIEPLRLVRHLTKVQNFRPAALDMLAHAATVSESTDVVDCAALSDVTSQNALADALFRIGSPAALRVRIGAFIHFNRYGDAVEAATKFVPQNETEHDTLQALVAHLRAVTPTSEPKLAGGNAGLTPVVRIRPPESDRVSGGRLTTSRLTEVLLTPEKVISPRMSSVLPFFASPSPGRTAAAMNTPNRLSVPCVGNTPTRMSTTFATNKATAEVSAAMRLATPPPLSHVPSSNALSPSGKVSPMPSHSQVLTSTPQGVPSQSVGALTPQPSGIGTQLSPTPSAILNIQHTSPERAALCTAIILKTKKQCGRERPCAYHDRKKK